MSWLAPCAHFCGLAAAAVVLLLLLLLLLLLVLVVVDSTRYRMQSADSETVCALSQHNPPATMTNAGSNPQVTTSSHGHTTPSSSTAVSSTADSSSLHTLAGPALSGSVVRDSAERLSPVLHHQQQHQHNASRGGGGHYHQHQHRLAGTISFIPQNRGQHISEPLDTATFANYESGFVIGSNGSSGSSSSSNLHVTLQPPDQQCVHSGSSVVLQAEVQDRLKRTVYYQWYRGRQPLANQANNIMILHDVQPGQAGKYRCKAYTKQQLLRTHCSTPTAAADDNRAEAILTSPTEVRVIQPARMEAPRIRVQPQSVIARRGDGVQLSCIAEGHPTPSYLWYMSGAPLPKHTESALCIDACTEEHAGIYTCEIRNSSGHRISRKAEVRVYYPPITGGGNTQAYCSNPVIMSHPSSVELRTSQQPIELECLATGAQPLYYQWYRNDRPLPSATSSLLTLRSECDGEDAAAAAALATEDHRLAGVYMCSVSNHFGSQSSHPATVHPGDPVSGNSSSPSPGNSPNRIRVESDEENSSRYEAVNPSSGRHATRPLTLPMLSDSNSDERLSAETQRQTVADHVPTTIPMPLILQHPPLKLCLTAGSRLQLHCKAAESTGHGETAAAAAPAAAAVYQWYRVTPSELETHTLDNCTAEHLEMTVSSHAGHSGMYYCRVTVGQQKAYSQPCSVLVTDD
ncbi:hemicentin-1-like isoform X2 [Sycon ciliatum]|uniref:hemicentin-1-like isoform X2 n=1 Tax=Sycon ciliatum TaxID=27933 RepID=UPI0031F64E88